MEECSICKGEMNDPYGHNAQPLNDGRCCDICNTQFVIPERIKRVIEFGYDKATKDKNASNKGQ